MCVKRKPYVNNILIHILYLNEHKKQKSLQYTVVSDTLKHSFTTVLLSTPGKPTYEVAKGLRLNS